MPSKNLHPFPVPAKRGSKAGWVVVGGEVPPERADQLRDLAARRQTYRSSLVCEAVEQYLDREQAA